MGKAPGVATSTHKKEVEMLADMAEGILIDDPTKGTEGQLSYHYG